MPSIIILQGSPSSEQEWELSDTFTIGRSRQAAVRLNDPSISRVHAEVFFAEGNWMARDLGSTNGTFVNNLRLADQSKLLQEGDTLKVGDIPLQVSIREHEEPPTVDDEETSELIETEAHANLDQVLADFRGNVPQPLQAEDRLMALLRATRHLEKHADELALVDSVLEDVLSILKAQRAALVIADDPKGPLHLQAVRTTRGGPGGNSHYSRGLAERCLREGKSILCPSSSADKDLSEATSVLAGQMSSIMCLLLRTSRKRIGILHIDRPPSRPQFTVEDLHLGDALAAIVSSGIESARLYRQQEETYLSTLKTLAQAVELRDPYTAGHAQRVTYYAKLLAQQLHIPEKEIRWLEIGGPLHDIGKIGIEDAILLKQGTLTEEEFQVMKSHTTKGYAMLNNLKHLAPILPIVRSHHERWDGRGYPDGLAGESIPLLARVTAVADAFDAMTTDRPYRKGMPFAPALQEIINGSGSQFDAQCAEAFILIQNHFEEALIQQSQAGERGTKVIVPITDAIASC